MHSKQFLKTKILYQIGEILNITSTPVIPTGLYPHMPIPSQRWLIRCSVITGQFVTLRCIRCVLPKVFTFWPWGLSPGPKFTKIADDLLPTQVYHPAKFHRCASTHATDIQYRKFVDKQPINKEKEIVNTSVA